MTIYSRPICLSCARYQSGRPGVWGLYCEAFGDAKIPDAILQSAVDHRNEHVEGDHGLLFAPKGTDGDARAAQAWADAHPERRPTPGGKETGR